jgi:hypothetical protein
MAMENKYCQHAGAAIREEAYICVSLLKDSNSTECGRFLFPSFHHTSEATRITQVTRRSSLSINARTLGIKISFIS